MGVVEVGIRVRVMVRVKVRVRSRVSVGARVSAEGEGEDEVEGFALNGFVSPMKSMRTDTFSCPQLPCMASGLYSYRLPFWNRVSIVHILTLTLHRTSVSARWCRYGVHMVSIWCRMGLPLELILCI